MPGNRHDAEFLWGNSG